MSDITIIVATEATKAIGKWFKKAIVEGVVLNSQREPVLGCIVSIGEKSNSTSQSGKFIIEAPPLGLQKIHIRTEYLNIPNADQLYIERGSRTTLEIIIPIETTPTPETTLPPRTTPNPETTLKEMKPSTPQKTGGSKRSFERRGRVSKKKGDWDCPSCGFSNFASRHNCKECHTPSPHKVSTLDSSRGDWICRSCGFGNFGKRHNCKDCHAPK